VSPSNLTLRSAFMLCLVVPAVACQAPVEPVASPEPSATTPIELGVLGDGPVIDPADYGAAYLLPGATVVDGGTIHLFPVAFSDDSAVRPRVLHLISEDGTTWTGDADASVLEAVSSQLDEIGAVPSSAFIDADGTWVMYGGGRLPGGTQSIIWRATAPGPDGPWTPHPEPVLTPDGSGWDGAITDHPGVLPTADGYLMGYGGAGLAAPNRNRIGMAASTDGITWTRIAATMAEADDADALGPAACDVDARTMFEPHLLAADDGHLLVFGVMRAGMDSAMRILTATSSDGATWTCASEGDGLGSDDFPGEPAIHSLVPFEHDGSLHVLVEVLGDGSSSLWLVRAGG
jgi:predicted GH43/DUF377 family glycosyl hydrolase